MKNNNGYQPDYKDEKITAPKVGTGEIGVKRKSLNQLFPKIYDLDVEKIRALPDTESKVDALISILCALGVSFFGETASQGIEKYVTERAEYIACGNEKIEDISGNGNHLYREDVNDEEN